MSYLLIRIAHYIILLIRNISIGCSYPAMPMTIPPQSLYPDLKSDIFIVFEHDISHFVIYFLFKFFIGQMSVQTVPEYFITHLHTSYFNHYHNLRNIIKTLTRSLTSKILSHRIRNNPHGCADASHPITPHQTTSHHIMSLPPHNI